MTTKKMTLKKIVATIMVVMMGLSFMSGCGQVEKSSSVEDNVATVEKQPIVMKMPTYKAGSNTGAAYFVPMVERFNVKYAGTYKVEIEQIPQESYNDKIKQLAQQKMLPSLIEGGDPNWIKDYVVPNKISMDLGPWLEAHPEVKNLLVEDSLKYATADGRIFAMPVAISRPQGIFYNSTKYTPNKRIKDMTFDEFVNGLSADTKFSLSTGGNAYMSMCLYTALIANEPGGAAWLKNGAKDTIVDFMDPIIIAATEKLQKIATTHGADNMLNAAGPDAANAFMSNNTALIATGPWFASNLNESESGKWSNEFNGSMCSADIFPGNIAISNNEVSTWWIPENTSETQREVALALIEFMYTPDELETVLVLEGGVSPNLEASASFVKKQKDVPILYQLNSAIDDKTTFVPPLEGLVPSSIAANEFGKTLIKLYDRSISAEEFCKIMTEKSQMAVE